MAEAWTIKAILEWTTGYFERAGIEDGRSEAEFLLGFLLNCGPLDLRTGETRILKEKELNRFREMVRLRRERVPYSHITGEREFMGYRFMVTPDTLIPRPETEHVVEECVKLLAGMHAPVAADLGTGTGCIAVSIAKLAKLKTVYAVDISPGAIAVAQRNIAAHGCIAKVLVRQGDLFGALDWSPGEDSMDLVVSNPPYIPAGEIAGLQPEVLREPRSALDGGIDGLDYYRRIAADGKKFLRSGGFLVFEIDTAAGRSIREIVESEGYGAVRVSRDYAGRDRVLIAQRKEHG